MNNDELATKVLNAVQGKPEAVKAISEALASGDPATIQAALATHAGVTLTGDEAQAIAMQIKANPAQPAAYFT